MDTVYYIIGFLLVLGVPMLAVATIVYMIKPHLLNKAKYIKNPLSRRKIAMVGLVAITVSFLGFGSVLAATEPASVKQARAATEQAYLLDIEASRPKIQTKTETQIIPFDSVEQSDNSVPLGEKRVSITGVNGEKTITYDVTYVRNIETARHATKSEVTKQPITQITLVGTYVQSASPVSTSGSGYTNSQGNHVQSSSSDPTGATAQCRDGTYSYSQSRRGTCSHHGGVARWL